VGGEKDGKKYAEDFSRQVQKRLKVDIALSIGRRFAGKRI
jgi:hypothetical protein